jgi:Alw26I/Eco31I/Esp3I family type II restriction m6 adenine DNA methyltransferase
LFVEEILENYTHSKSKIGLLIPNTILNDKQSEDLRKRILENYSIKKIYVIKEKNDFFPDISQSLIFFNIDKTGKTSDIEIINNITSYSDLDLKGFKISVNTIKSISDSSPIIIETEIGFNILNKISRHKKIKNYVSILNLRGELDLTFHKSYITNSPTKYYLVKGANIEEFSLKGESEFVKEDFLDAITSKSLHSKSERICCQQISNLNSKKRVKFCHIKSNNILGNSCNYISLSSNLFTDGKLSLYYILGILNSNLIDWRFRITSSNNHVSNYEISELPLPEVTDETKKKIESLTKSLMRNNKDGFKIKWMAFKIRFFYLLKKLLCYANGGLDKETWIRQNTHIEYEI